HPASRSHRSEVPKHEARILRTQGVSAVKRRIGILSAGGDCPGINAVIRAATKRASQAGFEMIGFLGGYGGLVEKAYRVLDDAAISGLLHRGGTMLGSNNRYNPMRYPVTIDGKT